VVTIKLKPEQERIIRAEIESGHFHSPDEVLDHALAALMGTTASPQPHERIWRSS
jgi:Arc/MetJ-type ribon-helix-helix transcriptional regulator